MKRDVTYVLSIGAAIIPLGVALVCTWVLYEFAGIGVPRDFYDLIRSEESLYNETYRRNGSTGQPRAVYAPRWVGKEDEPLNMLLIGTSPSMHAVLPGEADKLEDELHVEFYNVARSSFLLYRYYGELRILSSLIDIDIVLLEYSLLASSDYHFTYMVSGNRWKKDVLDEEIHDAMDALRQVWKGGKYTRYDDSSKNYDAMYEKTRNNWLKVIANPDEPRIKPWKDGAYRTAADRRIQRHGTSDVASEDMGLLRTNYVALTVLERIYEFCVENQIALVIYVPPLSPEVTSSIDMPLGDAVMQYTRNALRYFSWRYNVKVFDYYDRYDELSFFNDPIHIRRDPAFEFSKELFKDLSEFMAAENKNYTYHYWRDSEN